MRSALARVLHDESGQTLVFALLAIGTLVAVLALVLDVGSWMRAQRRAQSVADAAALAGAQQLPDQAAAAGTVDSSAVQNNWSGTPLQSLFPDGSTIKVVARDDLAGFFAPVAGIFSISIGAQATARAGVSASLPNVAPIALQCQLQVPPDCDPWSDGQTQQFTFIRGDETSTLMPVQLPLSSGAWNNNAFRTFSACDARNPAPAECNGEPATAPALYLPFDTPAAQVLDAINGGGTALHLVPIFNGITTGEYNVVGFAVVTFANATLTTSPPQATVDVTFHRLFVDGRSLPSSAQPVAAQDFGVKAIALTG
jgi:Flp pilus assembly protein TadG